MNIKVQCSGLAVLLIITYFYMKSKRLGIRTQRMFQYLLISAVFCDAMDILSIFAIVNKENIPGFFCDIMCKTYLISLVLTTTCSQIYLLADIFPNTKKFKEKALIAGFLAIIAAAFIMLLPIGYHYDADAGVIYTLGPSVLSTYFFCIFMIIKLFIHMWLGRKRNNKRRREAIMLWVFIWISAALIQFFNNQFLLVSFSGALGTIIVYLMLENPEANLDRQTGLFNQNAMLQYLSGYYADRTPFSIISIVLKDRDVEQELIISNAMVFRSSVDELMLVYPNKKAAKTLERILENISEWQKEKIRMWICVPDASVASNVEMLTELIGRARHNSHDRASSQIIYVDEVFAREIERIKDTEILIQDAIAHENVEVFYQPIYSTREHRFVSAEALVRIRDEEQKMVPPGEFIPVAEENGMIIELGKVVFEKVCQLLSKHNPKELGIYYIEVNLSVVQGADVNLATDLLEIMDRYGVDPSWINLEITESASIREKKQMLESMRILRDVGMHFSLDDFGTGQSNLNYIAEMPVDIVKFDREMTQSYFQSEKSKYIMDAAMQMIHGMELDIVSEGIETKEQYDIMENLGIKYIQGYYFSKPLPEKEFISKMVLEE